MKRDVIAPLWALDFIAARDNVVFLGPPGSGQTHLAIGLSIRALPSRTSRRHRRRRRMGRPARRRPPPRRPPHHELRRLACYPLLVVDEVGYIRFEAEAANRLSQLVSASFERASIIVTSNKPFGRWGAVVGDPVDAAALIDRLVHHADVVNLNGESDRLKDRDLGRVPTDNID